MPELKMDTDILAKIFKALGHPTRVKIVEHFPFPSQPSASILSCLKNQVLSMVKLKDQKHVIVSILTY